MAADDQIQGEMKALRDHLNGQIEKPQVLIEKLNRLGAAQLDTYRKRRDASEITRSRQQELSEAKIELVVAQKNIETLSAQIQDINAQIEAARK